MCQFPCPHCRRLFSRKDSLKRHSTKGCKRTRSGLNPRGERTYTPIKSRFVGDDGLWKELTRDSENDKWPCPLCGKEFKRTKSIRRHIMTACQVKRTERSALREGFPLNCRARSTLSQPADESPPRNSIEGDPGRNTFSQRTASVDAQILHRYRQGVGEDHPYWYKLLPYPLFLFYVVSDPHGIVN